jgi:hypothetical protein
VRDGERAETLDGVGRLPQDRQLAERQPAVRRSGHRQQPRRGQFPIEHGDAFGLPERGVVVAHLGLRQQFGDHGLVDAGVLAHVEPAQVHPEHHHRPPDRADLGDGEVAGTVGRQRGAHRVEVAHQVVDRVVPALPQARRGSGEVVQAVGQHVLGVRVEPGVHAAQRPPVRLVGAERRIVTRGTGQIEQRIGRGDETGRHRQLPGEALDRQQVMIEGDRGVTVDGEADHLGRDERVAVTVAADPRTHRHRPAGIDGAVPDHAFEFGGDRRQGLEEAGVVVAQRLVDLVADPQLRQPQQRRLPERDDADRERLIDVGPLGVVVDQPRSVVEQDRLAADLGRMGGDDRTHP